jgi:glycosyltransferase involved in cell wall biosynthesis
MRVLHLDGSGGYRGGQRQLLLLAVAQQGADSDVAPLVLTSSPRLGARLEERGVPWARWSGPAGPIGLVQLRRRIARFAPDRVHVHESRALGAARVVCSPALQQSLVVHRRIDDPPRRRATTRWKYRRGMVVCVSAAVADAMAGFGVPAGRLAVVHSGVPAPSAPPAPPGERPARLLALGALVDHKGHDVLLRALALSRSEASLTLAGRGPLRGELERLAAALGLDRRVRFAGDAGEGRELLADCDLFVHPSRTEGLGTAVLDAMVAGRPVLASRAGGLPEAVVDGSTGWLVEPGRPERLAAALDRIDDAARQDPGLLARRGAAGRDRVLERFGVAAMVGGVREVYDRAGEGAAG